MKRILFLTMIYLFLCTPAFAETFHFASIEKLIEQEVGRLIIPEFYKKLGIQVTITPLPGKRAQSMAVSGQKDGEIMRIWTYGEENKTVFRVPTPYYYLETMAFIKKNGGVVINNKEDLRKYRLVKVRGVKHTNNITRGMPHVHDITDTEKMMAFLQKGRADVALTNTVDGILVLKKLGYTDIVPIDKPLARLDLYHYIHNDHKELVPKVDAVIKQMKASGRLKTLIEKAERRVFENR
jgi:polar amino acid transport system substrate-binding protein